MNFLMYKLILLVILIILLINIFNILIILGKRQERLKAAEKWDNIVEDLKKRK